MSDKDITFCQPKLIPKLHPMCSTWILICHFVLHIRGNQSYINLIEPHTVEVYTVSSNLRWTQSVNFHVFSSNMSTLLQRLLQSEVHCKSIKLN